MVKNPPAMQESQVQSMDQKDILEKRMAYPLQYSFLENSMERGATYSLQYFQWSSSSSQSC